jgi:hypothetical protein
MKTGNKGYSTNQGLFWTVFGFIVLGLILLMVTGTLQYRPQPLAAESKPFDHKEFCKKGFPDLSKVLSDLDINTCNKKFKIINGKKYTCNFKDFASQCTGRFRPTASANACYNRSKSECSFPKKGKNYNADRLCKWDLKISRCNSICTECILSCKDMMSQFPCRGGDCSDNKKMKKDRCLAKSGGKSGSLNGCTWEPKGQCIIGGVTDVKPTPPPPPPPPPTCTKCGEGTKCDNGKCVCKTAEDKCKDADIESCSSEANCQLCKGAKSCTPVDESCRRILK